VVKVAHHGSAKQDLQFIDAVHAAVALVSVGADNGYGLPNLPVLQRLSRGGARVLRTDLDGDCAVVLEHGALAVVRHGVSP
jgi:competence protein ComEC